MVHHLVLKRRQHHFQRLVVYFTHLGVGDAEMAEFQYGNTAPNAELETAPAEIVEHADFLDQPHGIIQRQDIDQRPEQDLFGALGHGGEEHAGRGRHAERRRVMLGHVIAVNAGRLVSFDHLQAIFVDVGQRRVAAAVQMVEDPEFHGFPLPVRGA